MFGEFALLRPAPRSATATALRDTELVRIDRKQFEGWVDRYPRLALGIAQSLVDRVRLTNRGGRPGVSATAVAIVGHRNDPFASVLAGEVLEELAKLGSVLMLKSAEYDRRFRGLGTAQTRFTDPMNGDGHRRAD